MIHYSFDDVLWIFKDLTEHEREYNTIFDNSLLCWMRDMHIKYNVMFDLYVFYNAWYDFVLSDTTDKYAVEFKQNAKWLRFGFHGFGFDENGIDKKYGGGYSERELIKDYELVTQELERITSKENISDTLRLSSFSGNKKGMKILHCKHGIKAFLCADKYDRVSYYLNKRQSKKLEKKGCLHDWMSGILFYKTTVRIETERDIKLKLRELKDSKMPIIVFCHEWAFLENPDICKERFEDCFKQLIF